MSQPQDLWSIKYEAVAHTLEKKEVERQEKIYELVNNQRNHVDELNHTKEFYYNPLVMGDSMHVIPEERRSAFVSEVFRGIDELLRVHSDFLNALIRRQDESPVVKTVSDLFQVFAPRFRVLEAYGENRENQTEKITTETEQNPAFKQFLSDAFQKLKASAKPGTAHNLKEILYTPLQRFYKYNDLLKDILKRTKPESPDHAELQRAMEAVATVGREIDIGVGRGIMAGMNNQIYSTYTKAPLRLNLLTSGRSKVYDGTLSVVKQNTLREIQLFLFDHMLVMARLDNNSTLSNKKYSLWRAPIPLPLIRSIELVPIPAVQGATPETTANGGAFSVQYLSWAEGNQNGLLTYTFVTSLKFNSELWVKKVKEQLDKRALETPINENTVIEGPIQPRCCVRHNDVLLAATDGGVMTVTGILPNSGQQHLYRKVIDVPNVSKIGLFYGSNHHNFLFVLTDKTLVCFQLEAVLGATQAVTLAQARKVADNIDFFRIGMSAGKTYVCAIQSNQLRSNIKLIDPTQEKRRFMSRVSEFLIEKEFYIPTLATSIDFLKSKLVVGCSRGFEIVDLKRIGAESNAPLMDAAVVSSVWNSLDVQLYPISVYRTIEGDFLLCFQDVAFRVDRNGKRSRPDFLIEWQGAPTHFAYFPKQIVAFSSSFVEINDALTGELVQAIHGSGIEAVGLEGGEIFLVRKTASQRQTISQLHLKHR
ncbi:RHO1 GDP-GTP exchange protein 2 [Phlyctochytrium planicorne]|nr:RHO1 GDP-GTP exchange protein 2 [Phlyctochytrium planicorne]